MADTPVQRIRFGEFELDVRAGELRKRGLRLRPQEQPFQILLMQLQHSGEVVTREEIRKRLWLNDTIVEFDHSIGTAIKKLRQALSDEAESPRYVETLPRRGFRFIFPKEATAEYANLQCPGCIFGLPGNSSPKPKYQTLWLRVPPDLPGISQRLPSCSSSPPPRVAR